MHDPDGVVLDSQGNLYVSACGLGPSDQGVFKIAPDLQVTKVMGAAGDGTHEADCPVGLDVDSADNVYVAAFLVRQCLQDHAIRGRSRKSSTPAERGRPENPS